MEGFEEDPAAAFLAREQDELAGIAADTLGMETSTTRAEDGQPPEQPEQLDFFSTEPEIPSGSEYEQPAPQDSYSAPQDFYSGSQDPYSAVSNMDTVTAVPECIKQWREEQEQRLSEKDTEETNALEELQNQAKTELEEWYNRHEEQLNQTKGLNRQAENVFIEERDEDVPGHEWERVARLCDFSSKTSKNTKDVSRMRSIFLQLKQTPLVRE
ncbi:clathrin light chain A-like [Halichondria panicea]|uniref:clathrin light chain A-like n=1 Tax=Halichondria panicea TaxID=6063 RepID=UPI00312B972D